MSRPAVVLVTLLLVALGGLSACGDETSPTAADPTESASGAEPAADLPDWPSCEDVWVAGAELPLKYKGCIEGGEAAVKADRHPCSYGYPIVSYDDRFYAVTGSKINEVESLKADKKFQQTLNVCSG
jgi:hypothetical protein